MFRIIVLTIALSISCESMKSQDKGTGKIKVMNFDQLEPSLHRSDDTVHLVNFWATWCAPCIKELPAIQGIEKKYSDKKLKVLLVSLDFPGQLESRLIPFLKENNITSEVILLDDPDQNRWIDLVDRSWSGNIPFTLIYGRDFRESFPRSLDFETLDSIVNDKLNIK